MQAISVDEVYAAVAEISFAGGRPLMSSTEIAETGVRNPFARLYDALIDPARCERTMALLLAAYAIAWSAYGTIAKSSQDLHFDIGEMFAWSHEVVWSAPTHPPLGPWLMRLWFSVMPVARLVVLSVRHHRGDGGAMDRVAACGALSRSAKARRWSVCC